MAPLRARPTSYPSALAAVPAALLLVAAVASSLVDVASAAGLNYGVARPSYGGHGIHRPDLKKKQCVKPSIISNPRVRGNNNADQAETDGTLGLVTARCGKGKKQCCDNFVCKSTSDTDQLTVWINNAFPAESPPPDKSCSAMTTPSTANDGSCCIPGDQEVTDLLREPVDAEGRREVKQAGKIAAGTVYGIFTPEPDQANQPERVAAQQLRDNLACMCCTGKIFIKLSGKIFCNVEPAIGDGYMGDCANQFTPGW